MVPEPSSVSPQRYGHIICSGYGFKTKDKQDIMKHIFKVFHKNIKKYAELENFSDQWSKDAGGHASLIRYYYNKIDEETKYSGKPVMERHMILRSFQSGLTCRELKP